MKNLFNQLSFKTKILCFILFSFFYCIQGINAQNKDSKGTDFWLMFDQGDEPALTIFITSSTNASGTVDVPGISLSIPFSVTANTVTPVALPADVSNHDNDVVDNKGIHVTANNEVTVYGLSYQVASTDAYLGLPTDVLDTNYIVLTYKNSNILNGSEFGVVASANSTTVTITPTVTSAGHLAGVPYNVNLNQGQTYELVNTDGTGDLTGTTISSDKPVGVFGSHQCANIPGGYTYCDYITEMLPPVSTWGKLFGTVPLKSRLNGDTWRFLASDDNTTIKINGVAQSPINKGQFIETILTDQSIIESDKPILVAQYSNGSSYSGNPGDPFMMLIPPLEQFLPNYTVTTVSGYVSHYINLIAPNSIVGTLTLDGTPVDASEYIPIGSTGYSGAQLTVDDGVHTLDASLPFGAFQYGFNTNDSYGYPGGQSFSPVAFVKSLVLTPETGSGEINTSQCFTALLTNNDNTPAVGVNVVFNVLGANAGTTGFVTTDNDGKAQFCYTGLIEGNDTLIASFGALSDSSYFTRIKTTQPDSCKNVCITDNFGYKWRICYTKRGNFNEGDGTVDLGGGVIWKAHGWLNCKDGLFGLHAINPNADNCASGYTDSFVYRGISFEKCNMAAIHVGNGNWRSFCSGGVVNRGTFSAVNCGSQADKVINPDNSTPAKSGKANDIVLKVSPNPVQNVATINYTLAKDAKVNMVVYNYMMQPIKTLVSGSKAAGNYSVVWNVNQSGNIGSGLYKVVAVIDGKSYTTTVQVSK